MTDSFHNSTTSLVSVIVPLYNQQRHIRKCIRSIMKQTYNTLEIIIVNDGSSDRSQEVVQRLATIDNRIILINQTNKGVAEARKTGYQFASGEWIVFVDSDDSLPKDSIETLYAAANQYGVDVVCGNACRQWGVLKKHFSSFPRSMETRVIRSPELFESFYLSFFGVNLFPVNVWGKIYRKRTIDIAMEDKDVFLSPRLHMGEDEAFNLNVFPYISSIFCLDKCVYNYRVGGLTSNYNKFLTDLLDFGDYRIDLLDRYNYSLGYVPLFIEYVNILISHIQQSLEYRIFTRQDAFAWLNEELDKRYLVQRMDSFFLHETDCPMKCRIAISRNLDEIVSLAEKRKKHITPKTLVRRALRQLTRLFH